MPAHLERQGSKAVIGAGWGDEGKGRWVDWFASDADITARYNGGDNAGHSVTVGEIELKLHLIPSGIVNPNCVSVVGSEVVVNPLTLVEELQTIQKKGIDVDPSRFLLDGHAQLIMPWHRMRDALQEAMRGGDKIGTTGRGIGPAYADHAARTGLKVSDLLGHDFEKQFLHELRFQEGLLRLMKGESIMRAAVARLQKSTSDAEVIELLTRAITDQPFDVKLLLEQLHAAREIIRPFVTNVIPLVRHAVDDNKKVLFEGAQGVLLDLSHGTYPFVTSSHPGMAGINVCFAINRDQLSDVIGVTKAFFSRVGEGPMPTELFDDMALRLRGTGANPWDEYGTTTGRPRRVGWFDAPMARFGARIGGATSLAVTKMDILAGLDTIPICTGYRVGNTVYREPETMDVKFLQEAIPQYEEQPGWEMPSDGVHGVHDIPENALKYLKKIEELTELPIKAVSFGSERHAGVIF